MVVDGVDASAPAPQTIGQATQVIYDSAKQVDTAFSVAPAPKFEHFTVGNMTLEFGATKTMTNYQSSANYEEIANHLFNKLRS